MSITKGELANRIHKALGVNSRFTEASPDQVIDTLNTVNDWMNSENGIGRRLGWIETAQGDDPDPGEETGLVSWAVLGVVYNCALLVAAYFEKQPSQLVYKGAQSGMQTISARTAFTQRVRYPSTMPKGHANSSPWGPNYYNYCEPIQTSGDFLEDDGGELVVSCGDET
jgi:hypothetical protein